MCANDLRVLPDELTTIDRCYEYCRLPAAIQSAAQQYAELFATSSPSPASSSERSAARPGDECHIELIDAGILPHVVRLFADVQCSQEIVQVVASCSANADEAHNEHADDTTPLAIEADVSVIQDNDNDDAVRNSFSAYVTVVDAAASFWVQPDACEPALERLQERLLGLEAQGGGDGAAVVVNATVRVGDIVAAKFDADELFYRAKVLSIGKDGEFVGALCCSVRVGFFVLVGCDR